MFDRTDLLPLNVAESGPLDLNLAISFLRGISNLATDMLTFPVTICPDEQDIGPSCLLFDVLGNVLVIL